MNSALKDIYTKTAIAHRTSLNETTKKVDFISWGRLAAILIGGFLIYFLGKFHLIALILAIIGVVVVFLRLVIIHSRLEKKQAYLHRLVKINEAELAYLEGSFTSYNNGEQYADDDHPYTLDLDIFGNKSIFHFLNRTVTSKGSDKLAFALLQPVESDQIENRQKASTELAPQLNWRQDFLAIFENKDEKGDIEPDKKHLQDIQNWLNSPDEILPLKWLNWGRYFLPILTIVLITFVLLTDIPLGAIIFILLIPGWVLMKTTKKVSTIHQYTESAQASIAQYAALISKLESQDFNLSYLQKLQSNFKTDQHVDFASDSIKKFSFLLRQLDVRNNPFAAILNIFGFWDIHYSIALERWKNKNGKNIPIWFDTLSEFDFLLSLSNLRYNYPNWINPEISKNQSRLISNELKHPLIFSHAPIGNNIQLDLSEKVMLITGSNMAGKSTFLRAVGVNLVLGYMGAPVNASVLSAPILNVFTSMRTKDNLHEDTSSFYAELKRLKKAIQAVEKIENTFLLFDEILKGTNSIDRHTGSRAIIEQILENKQAGIVATHDLDLAKLETETNGKVENWCFEVNITEGQLDFDYLIKKGVCSSFNATYLMHEMGFHVDKKLRQKKK